MKSFDEKPLNPAEEARTNMSFWLPVLWQIKMRVPQTIMVNTGGIDLTELLDGKIPQGFNDFKQRMEMAINQIGTPCFIRTGMLSDKHSWKDTCYLTKVEDIGSHIAQLVESSCIANIAGLPFDYSFWAVRKLIPTKPVFFDFADMPITKERRIFIKDGEVVCNHPYWPKDAFTQSVSDKQMAELEDLTEEDKKELTAMAKYVAKYFTDYWSVDFLQDVEGKWWLTDMAIGERSYHYAH